MSNAVVVGASTGVGRALARELAREGRHLVIVARDTEDLEATAADIRLRFGVECWPVAEDITRADWDVQSFARACAERLGAVQALLIPAGAVAPDDVAPSPKAISYVTAVNYVAPARIAAAFAELMAERRSGTIVLFSSIAAAAPRTKNAAYSAAKAALETYARALRHALSPDQVEVLVVALGYVDTSLSFGLELRLPVADPEATAVHVVRRLRRGRGGKEHYPRFWYGVTSALRVLPWFAYKRLQF